uniref:Uncharacterized protein n=1 Tax=Arundo donax TaxID=35708 RepID=A0A0A9ED64_ARUDO
MASASKIKLQRLCLSFRKQEGGRSLNPWG